MMNESMAKEVADKIFETVFNIHCSYTLEELSSKFAFDVKLPKMVYDFRTGEETWASSIYPTSFVTQKNMEEKDQREGYMLPKRDVSSLQEILDIWEQVNQFTTERAMNSVDVVKSDLIYNCQKVYHSCACHNSKFILFCDSCTDSEYLIASQRSATTTFSIRVDDSANCSNCYNVVYYNKISNSFFIQDSFNLHECMFCSHIANKKYCISNMQFEKEEYFMIKRAIIEWILSS